MRDLFKLQVQVRYDQKMAKYGQVAEQNDLRFIPAVFSHTGQIHEAFKIFVKEQIRLKLEAFEGNVKRLKVRSYMNCVSERRHVIYWIYLCDVFRMCFCYLLDRKLFLYSYDIVKLLCILYFTPFTTLVNSW